MKSLDNTKKLYEALSLCLDLPIEKIVPTLTATETPNWDSIATVNLVVELEGSFNISFDVEELVKITSVSAILDLLKSKGIQF